MKRAETEEKKNIALSNSTLFLPLNVFLGGGGGSKFISYPSCPLPWGASLADFDPLSHTERVFYDQQLASRSGGREGGDKLINVKKVLYVCVPIVC